jgi:hypothetical protein
MKNTRIFTLVCALSLVASHSFAQQFNFASIDVPNSTDTWAGGIGPAGQIVGGYVGALDGRQHGFLYQHGTFTTIDVPGTLAGLPADVTLETEVNGINPAGDMVGDYYATPGAPDAPACVLAYSPPCRRGFLYKHGQFSSILVGDHAGSIPSSITPDGSIYGCLHDGNLTSSMFGFVRTHSGDFKTLQLGGGELASATESHPRSMNNGATPDSGVIVGLYFPPGATTPHGFKIQNGVLSDYMFADPNTFATQIWGINPKGDFVGFYRNALGPAGIHGFLQPADATTPVVVNYRDPITGLAAVQTQALAINPAGAIVGLYLDGELGTHGFLAVPITRN